MELTHQFTVPAGPDETWEAFNDVSSIADCFPGAAVTSIHGDDLEGTVKIKLGPISLQYAGKASFEERDREAGRLRIRASGRDKRGQGTADATVTATLEEAAGGTQVDVLTELAITGKPAQFGHGIIEDVSERLLSQFLSAFSERMSASRAAEAPGAPTEHDDANPDGSAPTGQRPTAVVTEPVIADTTVSGATGSTELNLLSTALPVVVSRSAGYVVAAAVLLLIGWLIGHYTA